MPRFLDGLQSIGAVPERVPAYATVPGVAGPEECEAERMLLQAGAIHAIAFSSTAEVRLGRAGTRCEECVFLSRI